MRPTFLCIILSLVFVVAALTACFRVPVQVVQYQDEAPVTVAPVGTVHLSASTAVMNPRVMAPENVGPLPAKPDKSVGIDFVSVLLGVLGAAVPYLVVVATLWAKLRGSIQIGTELVNSFQRVKEAFPISKENVTSILSENQSKKTKDFVAKVKNKKGKPCKSCNGREK